MPTVAIVGGGYAGVQAAHRLQSRLGPDWTITLIDRSPCHQLLTRLPEVVAGVTAPERACVPYRRFLRRRVEIIRGDVLGIDPDLRRVTLADGVVDADRLIVSLGTRPDTVGVPGAQEHAILLRSFLDAVRAGARLRELCARQRLVRVTIVGAGYTGSEVAGELAEWSRRLARSGDPGRIEATVVAQDSRLLPEGNARLAAIAEAVLRRKGVTFHLGRPVREIGEDRVMTADGLEIPSDIVFWAAHSEPSQFIKDEGWKRGKDGRILVDPFMRARGFEGVYVVGDDALAYDYRRDAPVPATAQMAVQEGDTAAHNVVAEIEGRSMREFRPQPLGEALSLGGHDGVAEVAGVVVAGRAAVAVKEAALLRYLGLLGGARLASAYR